VYTVLPVNRTTGDDQETNEHNIYNLQLSQNPDSHFSGLPIPSFPILPIPILLNFQFPFSGAPPSRFSALPIAMCRVPNSNFSGIPITELPITVFPIYQLTCSQVSNTYLFYLPDSVFSNSHLLPLPRIRSSSRSKLRRPRHFRKFGVHCVTGRSLLLCEIRSTLRSKLRRPRHSRNFGVHCAPCQQNDPNRGGLGVAH